MTPQEKVALAHLCPSDGSRHELSALGAAQRDLDVLTAAHALKKAKPSRREFEDSALAWIALAQSQLGSLRFRLDYGEVDEALEDVKALGNQVEFVRRALTEMRGAT